MVYEWDEGRARRARFLRMTSMLALSASAICVSLALLLTAAPF